MTEEWEECIKWSLINILSAFIIAGIVALICEIAYAWTDWKCVQDCLDRGYMYDLCQKVCSY